MIFKKHISIILAFFLLVSNLGLAFNVHYCDDEIASITLNSLSNSQEIEKDCCGIIEKDSKCCNDKLVKSNEKSDLIIVNALTFNADFILVFNDWKPVVFAPNNHFEQSNFPFYYCDANAPPLYLMYSQFIFYA